MTLDSWQSFGERIAWEGALQVTCEPLDTPLELPRRARLEQLDAGVLATLNILAERSGEPPADESVAAALTRIDAKLDVLLEMFNRHLLGHVQLPPRRKVRFNQRGILIEGWASPAPGTRMLVCLHFDACIGLPLELPGVTAAAPPGSGGFVAFEGLDEEIRQGIEHLVFRQHRRQLAEARREPHSVPPQQTRD